MHVEGPRGKPHHRRRRSHGARPRGRRRGGGSRRRPSDVRPRGLVAREGLRGLEGHPADGAGKAPETGGENLGTSPVRELHRDRPWQGRLHAPEAAGAVAPAGGAKLCSQNRLRGAPWLVGRGSRGSLGGEYVREYLGGVRSTASLSTVLDNRWAGDHSLCLLNPAAAAWATVHRGRRPWQARDAQATKTTRCATPTTTRGSTTTTRRLRTIAPTTTRRRSSTTCRARGGCPIHRRRPAG